MAKVATTDPPSDVGHTAGWTHTEAAARGTDASPEPGDDFVGPVSDRPTLDPIGESSIPAPRAIGRAAPFGTAATKKNSKKTLQEPARQKQETD